MTTRQLYYFTTIYDQGSLSAASQVLGISQPALSKFLSGLEDELSFLLFFRYKRQLTPTAVGRYFNGYAQRILDEQSAMIRAIRTLSANRSSRIRLATAPNRAAIIYSNIYNEFASRYPGISLSLTEIYAKDQPSAIIHGQIDLAIGSGRVSDRVSDIPIAYEELLVSLPVSHPMSGAASIKLTDLKNTPFVLQGPRHSIRLIADELFSAAGFNPVVAFESNDVFLVDSMLHQAVGAGLVSQPHVFPCDELVYRPLDPPVRQTLHIRYPLGHELTEPELFLAGLLTRERLSDPRYTPISSPEVDALLACIADNVETPSSASTAPSALFRGSVSGSLGNINLSSLQLEYILSIVDEKSLTAAAEKHYLTQPALSRHLHNIENMLCTRLFTREHNRLRPTNAGNIFANYARSILSIEEEMNVGIKSYRHGHSGGLCLYCDPMAEYIIRTCIKNEFELLHPTVSLDIVEAGREECIEALLNASADYGLFFTCEPVHPILDYNVLAVSGFSLVLMPGDNSSSTSTTASSGLACGLPSGAPGSSSGMPGSSSGTPEFSSRAPGSSSGMPGSSFGMPEFSSGAPGSSSGTPEFSSGTSKDHIPTPLLLTKPSPESSSGTPEDCTAPHLSGTRPVMLARPGTSLRADQDSIIGSIYSSDPEIVCEAEPSILLKLSGLGVADTILPSGLLRSVSSSDTAGTAIPLDSFPKCSLVLASHPGRTLPPPGADLVDLLMQYCPDILGW